MFEEVKIIILEELVGVILNYFFLVIFILK